MAGGITDSSDRRGHEADRAELVACPCHEGCSNLVFDEPCISCVIRRETGLLPCDPEGRAPTLSERELHGL